MGVFARVKSATMEDLKTENPALFEEIFDIGHDEGAKASTEYQTKIEELTTELTLVKKQLNSVQEENKNLKEGSDFSSRIKIITFASKFGLVNETCEMLVEGKSNEDIYEFIAESGKTSEEANSGSKEKLLGVFEQTAPPAAGDGKSSEMDCESVKTYAEARDFIMKRDGCSKADAAKKARIEFAQICDKEFSTGVEAGAGSEVSQETEEPEANEEPTEETEETEAEETEDEQ